MGNDAETCVFAKSYARETTRVWETTIQKCPTLLDLLEKADSSYYDHCRRVEKLSAQPPSFERYQKVCAAIRDAYAKAIIDRSPLISVSKFPGLAFKLLEEPTKVPDPADPQSLFYTPEEAHAHGQALDPALELLSVWNENYFRVHIEMLGERHEQSSLLFNPIGDGGRSFWNPLPYQVMGARYSRRNRIEAYPKRFEFMREFCQDGYAACLKEVLQDVQTSEFISAANLEAYAKTNIDLVRQNGKGLSPDVDDVAFDRMASERIRRKLQGDAQIGLVLKMAYVLELEKRKGGSLLGMPKDQASEVNKLLSFSEGVRGFLHIEDDQEYEAWLRTLSGDVPPEALPGLSSEFSDLFPAKAAAPVPAAPTAPRPGERANSHSAHIGETFCNVKINEDGCRLHLGRQAAFRFRGKEQWDVIDKLVDAWFDNFSVAEVGQRPEIVKLFSSKDGKRFIQHVHFELYSETKVKSPGRNSRYTGKAWFIKERISSQAAKLK